MANQAPPAATFRWEHQPFQLTHNAGTMLSGILNAASLAGKCAAKYWNGITPIGAPNEVHGLSYWSGSSDA